MAPVEDLEIPSWNKGRATNSSYLVPPNTCDSFAGVATSEEDDDENGLSFTANDGAGRDTREGHRGFSIFSPEDMSRAEADVMMAEGPVRISESSPAPIHNSPPPRALDGIPAVTVGERPQQ